MRTVRASWRSIVMATIICVFMLASGCSLGPKVPDVVGKPSADAVRILQEAGYILGDTSEVYTPEAVAGTVFQQDPAAGTRLSKGSAVSLKIALPLGEYVVPNVIGKGADDASATIAGASLKPVKVDQYSDTVAVGAVIGQVPAPGAKVDLGALVYYAVSTGKAPTSAKVPNVVGKSKSDADKAIKNAGLKALSEDVYSTTVAKGAVVIQSPAAGSSVAPGTTVSYAVSLGRPTSPVSVPNVTGKSEADAVAALQNAGLGAQVYRQTSASVPEGVVIEQVPPAGSQTAPGGTVGIAVSLGADTMAAVPDVTGMMEAEARTALEDIGLVVQTTEQPRADVEVGSVIAQLPVAGSKVPVGSTVVLAISKGTP